MIPQPAQMQISVIAHKCFANYLVPALQNVVRLFEA